MKSGLFDFWIKFDQELRHSPTNLCELLEKILNKEENIIEILEEYLLIKC